jgi:hypothetical protein
MPQLTAPVVKPGSVSRAAQPFLAAGELRLRPWQLADGPAIQGAYSEPDFQHLARAVDERLRSRGMD